MYSKFLQPCILEPTRTTANNRPSIIDNIFANTIDKKIDRSFLLSTFFVCNSPPKIRKIRNITDLKKNVSLNHLYKFDIYTKGT